MPHEDLKIAERYIKKAEYAKSGGHEFSLSFKEYKRLGRVKLCAYTGIVLTDGEPGQPNKASTRTLDRIDSTLGYVEGNVLAVCHAANKWKSFFENPNVVLTPAMAQRILNVVKKQHRIKKYKSKPAIAPSAQQL